MAERTTEKQFPNVDAANAVPLSQLSEQMPRRIGDYDLKLYRGIDAPQGLRKAMWTIYQDNLTSILKEELDELQKSDEWFHPHSRLLVLSSQPTTTSENQTTNLNSSVVAYGVFRFDTEENEEDDGYDEVLYCYELQVATSARRQGLGRQILELMNDFGRKYKMKKTMLTCHKVNTSAIAFYTQLGFKYDVICPSQWVNSDSDEEDEEEVDYFILSKPLKH